MLTGSSARPDEINTYMGQDRALRAGRLGTAGLLLSVLAATAPLMVVAGLMPTTYAVMGITAQPLLFVVLGAVMALFGVGYAEMSRHVHNAGAFYAYIARGLGGTVGAGASYVALAAYNALQVGVYGLLGFEASLLLDEYLSVQVDWWLVALLGIAVTGVLGALKVDLNAKVLGSLLLVEVALVVVLDLAFAAEPGPQGLSLASFDPGALTGAGLGTALCFTVAAFLGFEQAPVYAEETHRPQTVVRRVMFLAVGSVAVFFALTSWLMSVATGPDHIVGAAREQSAGLLFGLAEPRLGGAFTDALHVLFLTGIFACMLAFHNVVARYAFAMGREGLLPAAVGRASKGTGAPAIGSLLQTGVALVVVLAFALSDGGGHGDPTTPVLRLFTWMGNVGALGVIALMAATSVAVIAFFVRRGAAATQGVRLACSGLAALGLTVIFGYAVVDFDVLLGADPSSALRWVLPGLILAAALAGVAVGLYLRSARPARYARIGLGNEAFRLEEAAQEAPSPAPAPGEPAGTSANEPVNEPPNPS
ncbi:APC family permease [Streptomyces sp. WMMC897]|uniref:APC family permease n=1 Tax=Streptomyces sp. WMMC897 TaxID=3014782 RepID=UPI0022B66734|nr:APC family permease [Streptomyces sp. WMMC897]MCZ7413459.1 APC family permease [Streptomyces sp. WMMC897]